MSFFLHFLNFTECVHGYVRQLMSKNVLELLYRIYNSSEFSALHRCVGEGMLPTCGRTMFVLILRYHKVRCVLTSACARVLSFGTHEPLLWEGVAIELWGYGFDLSGYRMVAGALPRGWQHSPTLSKHNHRSLVNHLLFTIIINLLWIWNKCEELKTMMPFVLIY